MNFYMAEIDWYNELEEKTQKEKCLTFGSSYADATERLVKYYGENNLEKVTLEFLYDSEVLPLSETAFDTVKILELY